MAVSSTLAPTSANGLDTAAWIIARDRAMDLWNRESPFRAEGTTIRPSLEVTVDGVRFVSDFDLCVQHRRPDDRDGRLARREPPHAEPQRPSGRAGTVSLNAVSTGPRRRISIRQIDAWRQVRSPRDPDRRPKRPGHRRLDRRHVGHDGDVGIRGEPAELLAGVADPQVELGQRLAATRHVLDVLPASGPKPPTGCRRWRHPRRCRSSARSTARPSGTGSPNASAVSVARRSGLLISTSTGPTCSATMRRLLAADVVERLVDAPLQPPRRVERGAPVANQDQHDFSESQGRVEQPAACARPRAAGPPSARPARRQTQTTMSQTDRLQRARSTIRAAPTGSGSSPIDAPVNGHQNTSVVAHAPSKTRCKKRADRQPEEQLATRPASDADHHHDR